MDYSLSLADITSPVQNVIKVEVIRRYPANVYPVIRYSITMPKVTWHPNSLLIAELATIQPTGWVQTSTIAPPFSR
jgi:hypothetical protein